MAAVISPFFGMVVDRFGKRVIFMLVSSTILVTAYSLSMTLPACDKCSNEMAPLLLSGIGYTIYQCQKPSKTKYKKGLTSSGGARIQT